jgi:Zn-dependent peptidase ImmA (M78 family)/transcriptional regulator with XRE-family HTH domain
MQVTFDDIQYNNQLVVLGRESRGISQVEMANLLGVSQGKLSKIENGLAGITPEELEQIAKTLRYPVSFFQRNEKTYGVGLSEFYHRKRQSVPQKQLNKIYSRLEVRRMEVISLLKSVDFDEPNFPSMDPELFNGDIEYIAQNIRATWHIPRGPLMNIVEIIEDAGGIIIPFDFEGANIDAITLFHPNTPPLIFINFDRPMDRVRFTLAHELGHIIMHRKPPSADTDIELQADQFASEFLMPNLEIASTLSNINLQKLASLKLYWKTSMGAILKKASDLGKITERQSRYLWMQLGKTGYRTHEPEELLPPIEKPRILEEIVKLHKNELKYSTGEISSTIHLVESEFRLLYSFNNSGLRLV